MKSYILNVLSFALFAVSFSASATSYIPITVGKIIVIIPIDDPPVAVDDAAVANEDTNATVNVLANDSDENMATVNVELVSVEQSANVVTITDGVLTYQPAANWYGTDNVVYRLVDENGNASNEATVAVSIVPVNDAPVASADSIATSEDTSTSLTLAATDTEGDPLTYIIVQAPAKGSLQGTAPNLTYVPDANVSGNDSFSFKVNDGSTDSSPSSVSVHINAVNDAPVASPGSVTTSEDTSASFTLAATDADADPLTYIIVQAPTKGSLQGTAPNLTYVPYANISGSDFFAFKASDGAVDSSVTTVSIQINAVNDVPVASPGSVITSEDSSASFTLSATDADADPLTYIIVQAPTKGSLQGTAPDLTYVPDANVSGSDSFSFKVSDGTIDSSTASVSVHINAVNDAPVASPGSVTTSEDTSTSLTLSATDADADPLTYIIVQAPTKGSLQGTAPDLTYVPDANVSGSDSFSFKVNDGTIDSNTASVSVHINALNDAPVASPGSVTTNEDTSASFTLAATDAEGDPLTYTIVQAPTKGSLQGTAPDLTYVPDANARGNDSFSFKVNDGTTDSNTASVSVHINALNDTPVASPGSVITSEDTSTSLTLSATDVDGDPLTYIIVQAPTKGSLLGTAPDLMYVPDANKSGNDSFSFKVNDGTTDSNTASVSVHINALNDVPVASPGSVITNEDTNASITLSATDVDGDPLTYIIVQAPTKGSLLGTAPDLMYVPDANKSGNDSFSFKVNDGTTDSNTASVSVHINAVNDAPVASPGSVTTSENMAIGITLSGSDVESTTLTYVVVSNPDNGSLSGAAPNLTYQPNAGFAGTDSFTFVVNDGDTNSSQATVTINVSDVPQVRNIHISPNYTAPNTTSTISWDAPVPAVSGVTYQVQYTHSERHPTTLKNAGTPVTELLRTQSPGFHGTYSFYVAVCDSSGANCFPNAGPVIHTVVNTSQLTLQSLTASASEIVQGEGLTLDWASPANAPAGIRYLVEVKRPGDVWSPSGGMAYLDSTQTSYSLPSLGTIGTYKYRVLVCDQIDNNDVLWNDSEQHRQYCSSNNIEVSVDVLAPGSIVVRELSIADSEATLNSTTSLTWSTPASGTVTGYEVHWTKPDNNTQVIGRSSTQLSYVPSLSVAGTHSFSVKACTSSGCSGGTSSVETSVFDINAIQAASISASSSSVTVGGSATISWTPYGDETPAGMYYKLEEKAPGGAFTQVGGNTLGLSYTKTFSGAAGNYDYRVVACWPAENVCSTEVKQLSPAISVIEGNSAPEATPGLTVTLAEDSEASLTLTGTDSDGDSLTFSIVTQPSHGAISLVGNGGISLVGNNVVYTPYLNFNGSDSFEYIANDGELNSPPEAVEVSVTPVNDMPKGVVTLLGDSIVGTQLTSTNTISDADGIDGELNYQWFRRNIAISGANQSSYILVDIDVGKSIRLEVSYTDNGNKQESMTSDEVGPVEAPKVEIGYDYDALGRLVKVTDATNGDREYKLDNAGNRTEVTKGEQ